MRDQHPIVTGQSISEDAVKFPVRLIMNVFCTLFIAAIMLGFSATETNAATTYKRGFNIVKENNKEVCYYYTNGAIVKGKWLTIQGKKYYFDRYGHQVTGWLYFSATKTKRYLHTILGPKGYLVTGFVMDSKNRVRYFQPKTGVMATGFTNVNGHYRYFDPSTGVMSIGSKRIGKYFYYLQNSSTVAGKGIRYQGGWLTIAGKTRYYDKKDGHAVVGWLSDNSKLYRMDSIGVMLRNTTFTVNGKKYQADKDGVVTEVVELPYDETYTARKPFTYTSNGGYLTVYDKTNGKYYKMVNEFATDTGVANGNLTDRDILAALCEAEAGDQGLIGMEAVAMCILNRTIKPDKEFPSEVRLVIYQTGPRQYSTTMGAVNSRLNGNWNNKSLAYQATDEALKIFTAYRRSGKPRVISGFYNNQDVNFMYFMMSSVFSSSYSSGGFRYVYRDHTFFVDWA